MRYNTISLIEYLKTYEDITNVRYVDNKIKANLKDYISDTCYEVVTIEY